MAPSLQAERELVGENELEELRKDGGQRVSEGPRERGTRRTRGWAAHQSCVWWLEIRDRIARGDCSLPKGYGHECVCVCVRGVGSSGSLSGGCIPCLSCTLWPLPAPIEALHFIHCLLCCLLYDGRNTSWYGEPSTQQPGPTAAVKTIKDNMLR